jgi:hypothetical protein
MTLSATVAEQIRDYQRVHRSRRNLLLHAVAIPLFWAGLFVLALSFNGGLLAAAAGVAALAGSVGLQGIGHATESETARPFTGAGNFLLRLSTESLIVFPRFIVSGGFVRAWMQASRSRVAGTG